MPAGLGDAMLKHLPRPLPGVGQHFVVRTDGESGRILRLISAPDDLKWDRR